MREYEGGRNDHKLEASTVNNSAFTKQLVRAVGCQLCSPPSLMLPAGGQPHTATRPTFELNQF